MGISHLIMCPTNSYNMDMETKIIKSGKFRKIADNVKPDAKRRIVISKAVAGEDVTYHIYRNDIGQIILDPQVSIPASEAWLYKNTEAREAVRAGLKEAAEGKVSKIDLNDL